MMNTYVFRRILLYCFALALLASAFMLLPPAGLCFAQEAGTAEAYNKKGLEFYEAGKFDEAIKAYERAIKLKRDYGEAYSNMGDAYLRSGDFKKAIESYKQAVRLRPDLSTAYNNMGTAYYKLGEYKKAIAAYQEALKINPKAPSTYYSLGVAYIGRGEKTSALEQYKILKELDAQTAEKLYLLIYRPAATVLDSAGRGGGVRLSVRVSDSLGNPINNLRQEDFSVTENEVSQTISFFSKEEAPVLYSLVVDNSGSFREEIDKAVEASKIIVNANRAGDETLVIRFVDSDKIETMQEFTPDKTLLNKAIDAMYVEGGSTALLDTVFLSAQRVAQQKPAEAAYRRAVILITDGEERASYYKADTVLELLRKLDVQVFLILLDPKSVRSLVERERINNPKELAKRIASETGGQVFIPKSTTELEAVAKQILNTIRTQYVIGYKPASPAADDKKFRKVEVKVAEASGREKATVTARAGYLMPDKAP